MTAIILAGGKGSRILPKLATPDGSGGSKALLPLGDLTILDLLLYTLEREFDELLLVTSFEQKALYEDKYKGRLEIVTDTVPGAFALGGLYTGLINSSSMKSFVFACDMPFVRENVIRYMIRASEDFDVTVPVINGNYEPLHAIYSKQCIGALEEQLVSGNYKIAQIFSGFRVLKMEETCLRELDPALYSFFNINTRNDYKRAAEILYAKSGLGRLAG